MVTDYNSATDVKLFGLMSPRDANYNLVEETYFLILIKAIVGGTSLVGCDNSITIKVSPDGATSHFMRFLHFGVTTNGLMISILYE
jgi:hypothetical protein